MIGIGTSTGGLVPHRLSWADFDALAQAEGGPRIMAELRRAERSRRLLLLRALVDEAAKTPDLPGPLPSAEDAWELLARVQEKDPAVLDLMLAHPYTGAWAGYTMRLLRRRISGVSPLWMHVGHVHAIAAAAAIRAGLNCRTLLPVYHDGVMLPTLGFAGIPGAPAGPVAELTASPGRVELGYSAGPGRLLDVYAADGPDWWGIRELAVTTAGQTLTIRLDDLDPYRGLYEPLPPQRLGQAEVKEWQLLLDGAWRLIASHLPDTAAAMQAGLDSLVPVQPTAPFRDSSASTGEAFGSAVIARPRDPASLAATLVHEFQHIRLGGVLHLMPLNDADPAERWYAPWRDDPRPVSGMIQGIYAFFGVTGFWRAIARTGPPSLTRRARFEFALWRAATWQALHGLRNDRSLAPAGQRLLDGIGARLGPWQDEPITPDLADLAGLITADHYAGWRLRHIRPRSRVVEQLTEAWLARPGQQVRLALGGPQLPTPVPDGSWSPARADLARLIVASPGRAEQRRALPDGDRSAPWWSRVPTATAADAAVVTGRMADAARGYRAELAADPDRGTAWAGLGLAMSRLSSGPPSQALLRMPELVRAVHRRIRAASAVPPQPDELAAWIGRSTW